MKDIIGCAHIEMDQAGPKKYNAPVSLLMFEMPRIPKLLFVDANIWLDFYRARTEAALSLLRHLEAISGQIIVTYQLEMEVKKNRQNAIVEGLRDFKSLEQIKRPGWFSDARELGNLLKGELNGSANDVDLMDYLVNTRKR